MAVIDSVLRQHRWQLEERQQYLADLESLAVRLRTDAQRLQLEAEREAQLAGRSLDNGAPTIDPVFLRPLIDRRDKLRNSLTELETQIAEVRVAVETAQQELKVYELSWTQRDRGPIQRMTRRARRYQEMRQAAAREAKA